MNLDETMKNHKKLWMWLAKKTREEERVVRKREYFSYNGIAESETPKHSCYICQYHAENNIECEEDGCILNWHYNGGRIEEIEGTEQCMDHLSLYHKWLICNPKDWWQAYRLAEMIAMLKPEGVTE